MDAIKKTLERAHRIVAITHVDPDGDAFGSLTAMGLALSQLDKQVTLACDDPVPARFHYLPLVDTIQYNASEDVTYDLVIALDCGDEQRMGRVYKNLPDPKPPIVNIDHHITNTNFGRVNLVNPQAVSTTEILYDLFGHMTLTLTADLALCLLTGLVTDTLGFRTVNVTAHTMKIASALIDAGADLSMVTMRALSLKPMITLHMWRIGLNNMKFEEGLVWTAMPQESLQAIGYHSNSSAGLVNLLANVEEAAMSAVLMEQADESVRVGFRARPPYDVATIARNLGGGGHPLAAGCSLAGPLAKAEKLVVDMCKEAIRRQTAVSTNGGQKEDW